MDVRSIVAVSAPIITVFIGFILKKYFYNRPRLITYYGHISSFNTKQTNPTQTSPIIINTHTVVVRNTGNLAAKNVRVGHRVLPDGSYNINPQTYYEIRDIPGSSSLSVGAKEIIFPTLVPNEQVEISYLYVPPITYDQLTTYVKSDEGFAKVIQAVPSPSLKNWQKYAVYVLLFIGCSTFIYWGVLLMMIVFRDLSQFTG